MDSTPAGRRWVAALCVAALVVQLLQGGATTSVGVLTVSLYKVTRDGALVDWHFTPKNHALDNCEFVYGPVWDTEHQQVSAQMLLRSPTVEVPMLSFNVTYHFHMICYDKQNIAYVSNKINFTTGSENDEPPVNYLMSKTHRISSVNSENPYPVSLDADRMHSSNIILGAVCGIIGFLIINITIVLVVRKYSHWQMRHRRILELEDQEYDYDGWNYLPDDFD